MRQMLLEIEPNLTETIGWGAPIFKLNGKNVAGLCAFKNHLVYSPQSSAVLEELAKDLGEYVTAKSSLQFPVDKPLPETLVRKLLTARVAEIS